MVKIFPPRTQTPLSRHLSLSCPWIRSLTPSVHPGIEGTSPKTDDLFSGTEGPFLGITEPFPAGVILFPGMKARFPGINGPRPVMDVLFPGTERSFLGTDDRFPERQARCPPRKLRSPARKRGSQEPLSRSRNGGLVPTHGGPVPRPRSPVGRHGGSVPRQNRVFELKMRVAAINHAVPEGYLAHFNIPPKTA